MYHCLGSGLHVDGSDIQGEVREVALEEVAGLAEVVETLDL
jgi:hypothetical protein